jgi:predicted O-methyltransferase YrrM
MSASGASHYTHEHDPRWSKVDEYTTQHTHSGSSNPSSALLQKIHDRTLAEGLPDIAVDPTFGKFLALQVKLAKASHVLEVGTLGGYSAVWMASMNPGTKITTVEVSQHHADVARENLREAGVEGQVEVVVGSGKDVLPQLLKEVEDGKKERIGMAFIDADKASNWFYFDHAVKMGKAGTVIVVDNVVRKGQVAELDADKLGGEDSRQWVNAVGARTVIENAGKDERVDAVVMQTVSGKNYDGFLFAVLK